MQNAEPAPWQVHGYKSRAVELMDYLKQFRVAPGSHVRLKDFDPQFRDKHEKKESVFPEIEKLKQRMDELQFRLYAERKRSLLICLQAPDAGGKDGVVRHVIGSMNPQGWSASRNRRQRNSRTIFCGGSNTQPPNAARS